MENLLTNGEFGPFDLALDVEIFWYKFGVSIWVFRKRNKIPLKM